MENNEKNKNLSLKYETLVGDVEKQISDLEELGFSMKRYRGMLKNIKEELENNINNGLIVDNNYTNNNVNERQFDTSDLSQLYIDLISSLEEMNQEISNKYDAFSLLYKDSSYLNECLSRIKVSDNPVSLLDETIDLLDRIDKSPTSDFKQIKPIIENAYKTVYNMMKLEALTRDSFSSESIFSAVKNSSIHSSFIAKLVQEECAKSQDPEVLSKLHQLESMGTSNYYLISPSLFRMLAISNGAPFVKPLQDSTQASVEEYKNTIDQIKKQATTLDSSKKKYIENVNEQKCELFKALRRAAFILVSLGITGSISVGTFKGLTKDNLNYRTISTEYDIQTGESFEGEDNGEYGFELLRNVSVLEESPFVYDEEEGKYVKTFTTYNLESNPRVKNPDEYVEMIKENDYSTREFKYINEKPDNFENQITKYFVTIKEYDYNDSKKDNVLIAFALIVSSLLCFLFGMLELILYLYTFEDFLFIEDKHDPIIKKYLASRQNAIFSKKELEENIKELRALIKKQYDLLNSIKSISCYKELCPEVEQEFTSEEKLKEMVAQSAPSASLKKVFGK